MSTTQRKVGSHLFTDMHTCHLQEDRRQQVKKNNVFMTSTLVQIHSDMNSAEQGPVKHSEHVLRPAILQPPHQAQNCEKVGQTFGHNALVSCKIKEKSKYKISEGNSNLVSENLPSARISVQLSTNQQFLGSTSVACQPNGKCSFKSCSSEFVFGENMVERVLGTRKLTQPQLENDSNSKQKTFKSILKFPINSPNSRADSINNTSLIESAAAFSSQPSRKYLLEKIDVITGEEAEHNVLKMKVQRANRKNLQITATNLEDYSIKVFLIQASVKDTGYLYAAIHHRLVALRSFDKLQKDVNQSESQSETVLQQLNCESCDEDEDDFIQVTKNGSGK
ncbi:Ran-binding protein 3-like [Sciurus carolinensis]|uniref:Ran-binding protein 3-like n=1 Tax=Sciurus carolinensis TaxID=30640 RepID=A0AA41T785_SCICA|nr:Ran-binding protein 3-like [Sciurus carolinensis]